MIIDYQKDFDGTFLKRKFAQEFYEEKTLRSGNVITFISSVIIEQDLQRLYGGPVCIDRAVNFCWQIPEIDAFGAAAFQRLYITSLANVLSYHLKGAKIEIDADSIIVHEEHEEGGVVQPFGKVTLQATNRVDNCMLGHIAVFLEAGSTAPPGSYSAKLDGNLANSLMKTMIDQFYSLVQDLFLQTVR